MKKEELTNFSKSDEYFKNLEKMYSETRKLAPQTGINNLKRPIKFVKSTHNWFRESHDIGGWWAIIWIPYVVAILFASFLSLCFISVNKKRELEFNKRELEISKFHAEYLVKVEKMYEKFSIALNHFLEDKKSAREVCLSYGLVEGFEFNSDLVWALIECRFENQLSNNITNFRTFMEKWKKNEKKIYHIEYMLYVM